MNIESIARFHSPLTSKFGIPRQSGLADQLRGYIVLEPPYRHPDAVRGLGEFDFLWLIWEFSANRDVPYHHTVRPPRLGGNERVGVFASRSPFRPNRLGLSCVRLSGISETPQHGPVLHVVGADLMDGTPIYDIKPYLAYADSHPDARSGYVDQHKWMPLTVEIPPECAARFSADELQALRQLLACDPRPPFHNDPGRVYGMPFGGRDVRFRVDGQQLLVVEIC